MNTAPQITRSSWLMVSVLGLVWGATFLVTEIALLGITPFWLAASRIGFASVVMVLIWGLRGFVLFEAKPKTSDVVTLVFIGAISTAIPFCLLAWGQQFVTAGFAGVSMASVALIVLPLAHFFVPGEGLTVRRVVGFVIGFIGVVILIGGQAFESTGVSLETPGRLACLGAAACYSTGSILMRRLPAIDPIGLAAVLLVVGLSVSAPVAFSVEGPPQMPDSRTLGILLFLGIVPTAAANLLRVMVIRSAGPVFMSLVNYQVPIWSVLMGAWILNEPLPPSLLYALGLILVGVGASQYGAFKRLFGKRP